MKSIKIPLIEGMAGMGLGQVVSEMETRGAKGYIDSLNWPVDFPYAPLAAFGIARSEEHIFISYFVRGLDLKAVYGNDDEDVWKDSCVEFFVKDPAAGHYYNFEFNCIGTCLASKKRNREDREFVAPGDMSRIIRHTSLDKAVFEEKEGIFDWQLVVGIPFDIFGVDPGNVPGILRANFYKCGDETSHPHYLSWNPVGTPSPDFHCPEFFGELVF